MRAGRIETTNTYQTKKNDPVTKGAKIGAGLALGIKGADILINSHALKKETGKGILKNISESIDETIADTAKEYAGNKKYKAAMVAMFAIGAGIAAAFHTGLAAAAGGGIGLLVKGHNDKKEAEKQELTEQIKAELENKE